MEDLARTRRYWPGRTWCRRKNRPRIWHIYKTGATPIAGRTLTRKRSRIVQEDDDESEGESTCELNAEARASTLSGNFAIHHNFPSKHLGNKRTIAVYMPPNYERRKRMCHPVIYFQDGQNVFDAATSAFGVEWQADETADRMIRAGDIEPVIMVGIYNTPDRVDEYTAHYDKRRKKGGRGSIYGRFVMEEVKPFIDKTYRTLTDRENTAVVGSSLGGLISLYMASQFPDRIGMCAALSPSLWWCNEQQTKDLRKDSSWVRDSRFWIDVGTNETGDNNENSTLVRQIERYAELLAEASLQPDRDVVCRTIEGGQHTEGSWAQRFDQVLEFLFG